MGLGSIVPTSVAERTFNKLWNVQVNTYLYNGKETDLETLLVEVTTTRAATIESEIAPVSTLVRRRNEQLEELGSALSELTAAQKELDRDDTSTDYSPKYTISPTARNCVNNIGLLYGYNNVIDSVDINKTTAARALELVKTRMDKLNNDSQSDLTRLQSLVDKRDDSFETASSLMSKVSDTRGNAVKCMS